MEMKPMTKEDFKQWQKENIDIIPDDKRKEYQSEARAFLKELGIDVSDKKEIKMI